MSYHSQYLTMRDGVRIAIDLYLPPGAQREGLRVPTIVRQTRYYRSIQLRRPFRWLLGGGPLDAAGPHNSKGPRRRFLDAGYAWVDVDVRGSGASFGAHLCPWSPEEVKDGAELVDWIVAQPWSNGRVGATGVSYDGTAAEMLLLNRHPAVKAIAPRFSLYDVYADIAYPGGIHRSVFTEGWARSNQALDENKPHKRVGWWVWLLVNGVSVVSEDPAGTLQEAAVRDHRENFDVHRETSSLAHRDSVSPGDRYRLGQGWDLARLAAPPDRVQGSYDVSSPHSYRQAIEDSQAAILNYGGWVDGGYPSAAIKRFLNVGTPGSELVLGPWNHGGGWHYQPRGAPTRSTFDHAGELLRFFDRHLRDEPPERAERGRVRYFTMVEERWKQADTWPPPGAQPHTLYLGAGRTLGPKPPEDRATPDPHTVNVEANAGPSSRWRVLKVDPQVHYGDRAAQDRLLLTYDSLPLEEDLEVTGHPQATLYLSSSEPDGTLFLYLEDVHPDGYVSYVTEGLLRLALHPVREEHRLYHFPGPWHSFTQATERALNPGEVVELTLTLQPTSYLFRQGHRFRIALAGADRSEFRPLHPRPPTLQIYRDRLHPSHLQLPVFRNTSGKALDRTSAG